MSIKEVIFPEHGTRFNREARKYKKQAKRQEKRIAKINNHKNGFKEEWPLAENDKRYRVLFFKKTGESLILKAKDLAEEIVPVNVIEIK
jgi:hypothetical protein